VDLARSGRSRADAAIERVTPGAWALFSSTLRGCVKSYSERLEHELPMLRRFTFAIPKAQAPAVGLSAVSGGDFNPASMPSRTRDTAARLADDAVSPVHDCNVRLKLSFPDRRLVQFDCGKLQALDQLLRERKAGSHRCLIFTQVKRRSSSHLVI
jgi:hypothetical protein